MKYSVFSAALLACAAAVVTGAPIFDNSVSNSKLTSTAVSGSGSGKSGNDVIVANSIGSTEIGTDAVDNDAIVADSVQGSGTGHTSALYDVIKAASIGTADIDATLKDDNVSRKLTPMK